MYETEEVSRWWSIPIYHEYLLKGRQKIVHIKVILSGIEFRTPQRNDSQTTRLFHPAMTPFVQLTFIPLIVEAILYVLYLATLIYGLRWLIFDDEGRGIRKQVSWSMLAVTTVTFLLMTTSLVLGIRIMMGPVSKIDVLAYDKQDLVIVRHLIDANFKDLTIPCMIERNSDYK